MHHTGRDESDDAQSFMHVFLSLLFIVFMCCCLKHCHLTKVQYIVVFRFYTRVILREIPFFSYSKDFCVPNQFLKPEGTRILHLFFVCGAQRGSLLSESVTLCNQRFSVDDVKNCCPTRVSIINEMFIIHPWSSLYFNHFH